MHCLLGVPREGKRESRLRAEVIAGLFTGLLCFTIGMNVLPAQSRAPGSGTSVSQGLSEKQAIELLASTLTSACGDGTRFLGTSAYWASASKTVSVRSQDGNLFVERVNVGEYSDGLRTDRMESNPKVHRVRLGDLFADPDDVDANNVLQGNGPKGTGISVSCQVPGCVNVGGLLENRLEFSVCPEKRSDVITAMQTIILKAGGRRKSGR